MDMRLAETHFGSVYCVSSVVDKFEFSPTKLRLMGFLHYGLSDHIALLRGTGSLGSRGWFTTCVMARYDARLIKFDRRHTSDQVRHS